MSESIYIMTLVGGGLVVAAAFSSLVAFRFGAPLLLVFLGIGLLAGENGLGIRFDNADTAYLVGALALAIILFDSGFGTPLSALRQGAWPSLTLATFGVVATAGLVALPAHYLTGFDWAEAAIIGTLVASTDAAAVFFLLRAGGLNIRDRARSILEIESGSNDPIAIYLTIALTGIASAGEAAAPGAVVLDVVVGFLTHMAIGAAAGLAGGWAIVKLAERLDLDRGLVPVFVLTLALIIFGLAGAAHGSAFLAVYVAGVVAGNARMRQDATLRRFKNGVSWLAQIVMFLVLGLFATPSEFPALAPAAIGLALFLVFVARPLAVTLCLAPFRLPRAEVAFVSWVGLRGAVSILLALLPIAAGLADGRAIFNVVFIIVVLSLALQGWTIGLIARRLDLIVPVLTGPVDKVELELPGSSHHELLAYRVLAESPVARGARIPRWARPSLVVREGRSMRYQFAGRLGEGDLVYIFVPDNYPRLLDRLFARREKLTPDDEDFFGAFAIDPSQPAAALADTYGAIIAPEERGRTIAALLNDRLGGRAEFADRVTLGPIDLIVRDIDERGRVVEAGVSFEQRTEPPVPAYLSPSALAEQLVARIRRGWRWVSQLRGARRPVWFARPNPEASMAKFRTLDDLGDIKGKRALVRVDLNVPMADGKVSDATRIERVVPTITELADKGAKVILLAHFGRPKGAPSEEFSLKPVAAETAKILGRPVGFGADCIGEAAQKTIAGMKDGDIVMLENTRFHKGEEKNDPEFTRALAANGDLFVNDAFSAAHRAHASTEGLAHHMKAYAGRTMQAELEALESGLGQPKRPVAAIVGGAKVSTKIDLLENLVKRVDLLVIGGGMANTFLAAQGVNVGESLCEHDLAETAKKIMAAAKDAGCRILLPADAVVAWKFEANAPNETVPLDKVPSDAIILDAGAKSIAEINAALDGMKTAVWNGPLGAFELTPFDTATVAVAKHVQALTKAGKLVSVAGGGDTVSALNHAGVADDMTYVSTAGGAFLEWMEGKALPGVEALRG